MSLYLIIFSSLSSFPSPLSFHYHPFAPPHISLFILPRCPELRVYFFSSLLTPFFLFSTFALFHHPVPLFYFYFSFFHLSFRFSFSFPPFYPPLLTPIVSLDCVQEHHRLNVYMRILNSLPFLTSTLKFPSAGGLI